MKKIYVILLATTIVFSNREARADGWSDGLNNLCYECAENISEHFDEKRDCPNKNAANYLLTCTEVCNNARLVGAVRGLQAIARACIKRMKNMSDEF